MTAIELYIHGKLVEYPDGPIHKGFEHTMIGRSANFPLDRVRPFEIGIGTNDLSQLARPDEGGIAVYPISIENENYLIAIRFRNPAEGGPGANTRRYQQAVYGAIKASGWRTDMIIALEEALIDPKLTAKDEAMPPRQIGEKDTYLPQPLMEIPHVKNIIRAVMSGEKVAIQESNLSLSQQLLIMQVSMAALPPEVSRQLSFGAGMGQIGGRNLAPRNGHVDIGIGQSTDSCPVYSSRGTLQMPRGINLDRGAAYVEFVEKITSGCTDTGQIAARVNQALQAATIHDQGNRSWPNATAAICEHLVAKGLMRQPVSPPPAAPAEDPHNFTSYGQTQTDHGAKSERPGFFGKLFQRSPHR